jgi:hypothetical protein
MESHKMQLIIDASNVHCQFKNIELQESLSF